VEIVKAADEEGEHTESIDRKPLLPVGHATSDAGHAIAPPPRWDKERAHAIAAAERALPLPLTTTASIDCTIQ